jgi:multidrug efflux pump subunit AcrB
MNPIIFALRHPITVIVMLVGLVVGSGLALFGDRAMKIDIFPQLNLPVIYVCQPYGGMDPGQMEGLITNYYEYHFLYISGIHHVESKNIQGMAMMKLYFHPGTDMSQAIAETIGYVNRSRAFMPPGTVPPFVMRFDTGSVPVGYLVLSSESKTIGEIQDQALFKVRPMFSTLPGVSAPPPFGGSVRSVVLRVDPDRLRAYNASPEDVIAALTAGNTISPSGAIRVKDMMPLVTSNAMVVQPSDLGKIPLKPGSNVYLRDLGVIEDATDTTTGYALINGRRAVYILVTKRAEASTLDVVNRVKANLPKMQAVLPDDIKVGFEFDQSPYVTNSMLNVGVEGLLGAFLTGLMVLVFLRDWRSVIVVVLNIPLSLLGAIVALWLTGQTINLMTLGGLALSVGILVDEATVEVENIHTQMSLTDSIARAVRLGNAETAVPRLLAMLCILAVFLPAFFMQGSAQALFVPLSLAVAFAMVTSYILSSSFVPVLSVWLLRHGHASETEHTGFFARFSSRYADVVMSLLRVRSLLLFGYLAGAAALCLAITATVLGWMPAPIGTEIFPKVDAGQFQLRLRAPTGTRIERTEEITAQSLEIIKDHVGPDNVAISLGYVGVIPSAFPINAVYQWMSGPEEAIIRIALKPGAGLSVESLKEELRSELPRKLEEWLRTKLAAEGFSTEQIDQRVNGMTFSFEPADIVNQVMSFGSATPIEIVMSGANLADNRAYAAKVKAELDKIASLRDVQYAQPLDYPTIEVNINREMAGRGGVTAEQAARSLLAATSSSRFVVPNYWRDPKSGIGYQVQVEVPIEKMNSSKQVGLVPIKNAQTGKVLLQDIATIQEGKMPGEYDRYNMKRLVSIMANIEGEDLGSVSRKVSQAVKNAGEPPRGVSVDIRGQIEPMHDMFRGLFIGLTLAVVAVFLLLTAYFQSMRLALIVMAVSPAVIVGVALMLFVTGTTLNIQSFMGAIMAIGVATANAILLVTFADKARKQGDDAFKAALDGARHRLRPILMTSFAMIAGMLPMALALGEGGQQVAPLGRAVIGGLLAATCTTLLILPAFYAIVMANSSRASVSLDPDDPESKHFDPDKNAVKVVSHPV